MELAGGGQRDADEKDGEDDGEGEVDEDAPACAQTEAAEEEGVLRGRRGWDCGGKFGGELRGCWVHAWGFSGVMEMFTMIRVGESEGFVVRQIFCGCTEKARGTARRELSSFLSR